MRNMSIVRKTLRGLLALALTLAAAVAAKANCGEPVKLAALYRQAVMTMESGSRGRLISALMPAVECLGKAGKYNVIEGLKGRYLPFLQAISGLAATPLRLLSDEELQEAVRRWKMRGNAPEILPAGGEGVRP